jgi:hypothetical protein
MKKIIISMLLVMGAINAYAQIELRPRAGGSYSRLNEDPGNFSQSGRPGFQIGADLMIGNKYFIMPGIEFSRTSYELMERGALPPNQDISVINGIRVPLFAGMRLLFPSSKSLLNINLFTGPSVSFVTSVNAKDDVILLGKEDYHDRIWGWNFGAMVDILVFYAQVGYELGISPVYNFENSTSSNRMLYANVGIRARF